MVRVIFVHPDGSQSSVEVEAGTTVMEAAVSQGIEGIIGECGGSALCATCHVYVEPPFDAWLLAPSPLEDEVLDSVIAPRKPTSRLGCQIALKNDIGGLMVNLPTRQA